MDFSRARENLEKRGYSVSVFESAIEAASYLNRQINEKSVGFGGSVTLGQMGLFDSLSDHNTVLWHHRLPEGKAVDEIRKEAARCQIYLSSVNALAESGEIVNIDGSGNRIASMLYGHEKVYLIAGSNKLEPDLERALWRARNVAAPLNAQRLQVQTPCALKADRCYDCSSPERICQALSVLWGKPRSCEFEVVLIHEPLGF